MVEPIGLVLAGGAGRRMGQSKGALRSAGGRPLALRAAEALAPLCRGVLISVRPGSDNPAPGYPAIEDSPPPGRGPLAGIHAGFENTDGADLLVLACDYPHAETALLRRLPERAGEQQDVVMLTGGDGRDHPLVALWSGRTRSRVCLALEQGSFGVRKLIATWRLLRLGPADFPGLDLDARLVNVNTQEDWRRL
jgi:molybdopterin-guanine dinucleotide biosynthesis protein A